MWKKKFNILVISVLLAFTLLSVNAIPLVEAQEDTNSQTVTFTSTNASVSGTFEVIIEYPEKPTVAPGETRDIIITLTSGDADLDFTITSLVGTATYGHDSSTPLGNVTEVLTGGYGVYNAHFVTSLSGELSVTGPGTLSETDLSWTSYGVAKTITVDAATAVDGDVINVDLDLKYNVSVSVDISGVLTYLDEDLGVLEGSISIPITVKGPASDMTMIIIIVIIVAVIITAIGGAFAMKKKKGKVQPLEPEQYKQPPPPEIK